MLSSRNRQIEAEESSGQPSVWVRIYNLMRCPGSPCHLGPYCWQDKDRKHYRLKSHHFRKLITAVQAGHVFEKHDDMPDDLREQLYAEEQQYLEGKRKRDISPPGRLPPIQITNVMPGGSDAAAIMPRSPIEIPGLRDVNVGIYSDWHGSHVDDPVLKQQFKLCGSLTLAEGYDLEQLWEEPNFQFLVDGGVKVGLAKRFIRDIKRWATDYAS
ncbi:hypothetical protein BJ166DRAFT_279643 [Pestalotiopsis sp. NC0098]|nr:hypothetical protein BJ166DRAFT_279643 [Pestalotiopsis sp. NC0098]